MREISVQLGCKCGARIRDEEPAVIKRVEPSTSDPFGLMAVKPVCLLHAKPRI